LNNLAEFRLLKAKKGRCYRSGKEDARTVRTQKRYWEFAASVMFPYSLGLALPSANPEMPVGKPLRVILPIPYQSWDKF
jgi:hypothetical protein